MGTEPQQRRRLAWHSWAIQLRRFLTPSAIAKWLSDDSLTRKAYLNAAAAGLDYAARLLVGFLITPLLVSGLGDYAYGVWRFLERLIGYVSPASGRPTQALKWTLANQQASIDDEEKRLSVGSTVAVWAMFLPLMVVLGGVLAWFAPRWLDAPAGLYGVVRLAAAVLLVNLLMSTSLVAVPRSVLEGENLGYKRMGLSAILVFVGGGFTWLALHFDTGLIGVALSVSVSTLLTGVIFLRVVRTYAHWFGVAWPSLKAAREFLGLSWWFVAWNSIIKLMMSSDVVVLGVLGSVESVTTYTLTKYAPETLITIVAIGVLGVMPGLGGIVGSGNLERASRVRSEIMSLTWLVLTALGSAVLVWNWTFIKLWVGAEHYAGAVPALLIVVSVMQFVLIRNDAHVIDLTLDLRRKVLIGVVSAVLSLAIAGLLVGYFEVGIAGLVLGFIAGRSILTVAYPLMVGRLLETPLNSQLRGVWRPALFTAASFAAAIWLGELLRATRWGAELGWIGFVLSAGITGGVAVLLAFYLGLSGQQRQTILRRVRVLLSGVD
jgi:O-antigen/teichoic acid export membrane protein